MDHVGLTILHPIFNVILSTSVYRDAAAAWRLSDSRLVCSSARVLQLVSSRDLLHVIRSTRHGPGGERDARECTVLLLCPGQSRCFVPGKCQWRERARGSVDAYLSVYFLEQEIRMCGRHRRTVSDRIRRPVSRPLTATPSFNLFPSKFAWGYCENNSIDTLKEHSAQSSLSSFIRKHLMSSWSARYRPRKR